MIALHTLLEAIACRQTIANLDELTGKTLSVSGVGSLSSATANQVAFLAQSKYLSQLANTQAGVVLISQKFFEDALAILPTNSLAIIVKDAYLAHACISTLFVRRPHQAIHPTAIIDETAKIGKHVAIGAYAIIGADVVLGDGVFVGAGSHVGAGTHVGQDSFIDAQVMIAHDCLIGQRVRIHSHASIGSEGFGFAPYVEGGVKWQRIAQLGRVVIGDDSRIGSNTCIDRGAVEDTVIGSDVIIDNLVQIAHNVQIGSGTAIAAKVGIAGSTVIGKNCIIGGAVGISGHIQIADGVTITGMTMVTNSIKEAGSYSSGTAAMPSANWRRAAVRFRQMGEK